MQRPAEVICHGHKMYSMPRLGSLVITVLRFNVLSPPPPPGALTHPITIDNPTLRLDSCLFPFQYLKIRKKKDDTKLPNGVTDATVFTRLTGTGYICTPILIANM
jgi:hypothetical protein